MASTSGSVTLSVSIADALAVASSRLVAYTIPVTPSLSSAYTNGSAAGMVSKVYMVKGTLSATTLDIDLTAVTCADGSTGFSHVREVIVFNDDATAAGAKILTMGLGTNPINYWLGGTTPTAIVHPTCVLRFACPIQTAGWVVDSTHKTLRLDSGSNSVAYRVVILGD